MAAQKRNTEKRQHHHDDDGDSDVIPNTGATIHLP